MPECASNGLPTLCARFRIAAQDSDGSFLSVDFAAQEDRYRVPRRRSDNRGRRSSNNTYVRDSDLCPGIETYHFGI